MKTLLMFVPLLATSSPVAEGWVNIKLGYCCNTVYRYHREWCWRLEKSGSDHLNHVLVTRVMDQPEMVQAAIERLVQQAQFSCDGHA